MHVCKYYDAVSEKIEECSGRNAAETREEILSLEVKGENWGIIPRQADAWTDFWRLNLKDLRGIP